MVRLLQRFKTNQSFCTYSVLILQVSRICFIDILKEKELKLEKLDEDEDEKTTSIPFCR